ncbi:nucleotide exchange factor GrpE [Ferroacidibacillus organovorans]|uniref:Protein GrpE n=1 Tax=Ferroacidibacillus organovorans TaxID=1765683 RepID=A0A101XTP8_9BACL|nr:nucleotide exchange factor GrpE [Ferroacidibacillus organovorans]KUO97382.1 hypothetical protein ATW55_05805 [Ferroacidibacillus organovorans]
MQEQKASGAEHADDTLERESASSTAEMDIDAAEQGAENDDAKSIAEFIQAFEKLKAEYDESQNRYLRLQADYDNFRRRTRQEREETAAYANSKLIGELLPVLDNFSLAMRAAGNGESEGLVKGVTMVYDQLQRVLTSSGVEKIECLGSIFDPNLHEAVVSEPAEGVESGKILEVLRDGYTLSGKVIRPAMVKIAS